MIIFRKNLFRLFLLVGLFIGLVGCSKEDSKNTINLRLESFALTLSPLKIADTESMKVASLLYSPLVAVNADGTIESRIAKKWIKIDKCTWEFELRDKITFSNGRPLQPEDVVSTISKAMQPTSPWAWALASIQREPGVNEKEIKCTGLQVIGDRKIRITQTNPVPWLLHALDGPPGWIVPKNADEGEYGLLPGTGPYTIHKITPDVSVDLIARTTGSIPTPNVKHVVFKYIADATQAGKMFEAGTVDALSINTPKLVDLLITKHKKKAELNVEGQIVNIPSGRVRLVIVNEDKLQEKGFNKQDVFLFLRTLNATVDRQAITHLGKEIIAEPLNTAFPPSSATHLHFEPLNDDDLKTLPNVELSILTESDVYSDLIASIVAQIDAGKVKLSYRGMDKGMLINALVTKNYDLVSTVLDANIKTPTYWASFFQPGNPFNIFGKPLPELSNIDFSSQEGIDKAGEIIDRDGNWVGLIKERRIFALHNGITGIRFTPSGQPRFENIAKYK